MNYLSIEIPICDYSWWPRLSACWDSLDAQTSMLRRKTSDRQLSNNRAKSV